MGTGPLVVTYPLTGRSRAIVEEELGETAEAIYLVDLAPAARFKLPRRGHFFAACLRKSVGFSPQIARDTCVPTSPGRILSRRCGNLRSHSTVVVRRSPLACRSSTASRR